MKSVAVGLLAKITVEMREVVVIKKPDFLSAVMGKSAALGY